MNLSWVEEKGFLLFSPLQDILCSDYLSSGLEENASGRPIQQGRVRGQRGQVIYQVLPVELPEWLTKGFTSFQSMRVSQLLLRRIG